MKMKSLASQVIHMCVTASSLGLVCWLWEKPLQQQQEDFFISSLSFTCGTKSPSELWKVNPKEAL